MLVHDFLFSPDQHYLHVVDPADSLLGGYGGHVEGRGSRPVGWLVPGVVPMTGPPGFPLLPGSRFGPLGLTGSTPAGVIPGPVVLVLLELLDHLDQPVGVFR
jgi:hypothetical protein